MRAFGQLFGVTPGRPPSVNLTDNRKRWISGSDPRLPEIRLAGFCRPDKRFDEGWHRRLKSMPADAHKVRRSVSIGRFEERCNRALGSPASGLYGGGDCSARRDGLV